MTPRIKLRAFLFALPPALLATVAFPQDAKTSDQAIPSVYQKWLDEDVRWIITDRERADFATLTSDQQRDAFVEKFWEHRNPDPGSKTNVFKEEHYRRLAYANTNFAARLPGYQTDRGRIYVLYGPPDEREQHPGRAPLTIPPSAPASSRYPSDVWRYQFIQGVGRNILMEFIDTCECGDYRLAHDPADKH